MKKIITLVLFFCLSNILSAQPVISDAQPQGGGVSKSSACVGEIIRLIGSGYLPTGMTITVNSGPTVSVYNFVNANTIEFMIPPGTPASGPGIIVVALSQSSNPRSIAINAAFAISIPPVQQSVCEGTPFNFAINAPGAMSYLWRKNGISTGITTSTLTGIALASDSGAFYSVDIQTSTCGISSSTPVKLLVNTMPGIPATLPNINQCQSGTFALNAPVQLKGIGIWKCINNCGSINFSNASAPNSNVSNVPLLPSPFPVVGWEVTNGQCKDTTLVSLLNYSMPTTTALIFGADTNICVTTPSVTLVGNTPTGTYTNVDWSLQGPSTGTFTSPTISYTDFTPTSGAAVYKVNYTIRNGACNSISPDKKITVFNNPLVSAGPDIVQCYGTSILLNGSVLNSATYSWTVTGNSGSISSPSSLNTLYTPAGADSLGVTLSFTLSASNLGCTTLVSDASAVTIRQKSSAYIPTSSNFSICAGGSATIPINFIGIGPFSGIGLFDGNTNTDLGSNSGPTVNKVVNPITSTNYTLAPVGSFIDGNGCPGTWSGNSFVSVSPGPTATISILPASICAGENATLAISPSGGGGPNWKIYMNTGGTNTLLTTSTNYIAPISPTANKTYVIDSIETLACGRVKLLGVNSTIVVNAPPIVSASMVISLSDDTLCTGENSTVSINGLQSNTVYKIIKNFNNIVLDSIVVGSTSPGTAGVLIPFSKFTPGKIDTVKFAVRRSGCIGSYPSVNKAFVWTSNMNTPTLTTLSTTAACERQILATTTQPNVLHKWYDGTGIIVGATGDNNIAYFSGSYSVMAIDTLLCKLSSNTINISYSALQPTTSVSDISSAETKLTANAAADQYFWYAETSTGIKKIQGANSNSISVYFDGNYYLGTITGSCYFMSNPIAVSGRLGGNLLKQSFVETDSTVLLPEIDFSSNASVYPNPVSNNDITVDYIAGSATKVSFILYNPQGVPIIQKEVDGNGIIRTELPSKYLQTGIYSLYIYDGVKQVKKNIMIY